MTNTTNHPKPHHHPQTTTNHDKPARSLPASVIEAQALDRNKPVYDT